MVTRGIIEIPDSRDTSFDHGAFDPKTRRVFVAHTTRDSLEVIDHDTSRHIATLKDFPETAGVVAHDGNVLVINRGAASLAWLDAVTLKTRSVSPTAARPNGVAIASSTNMAIAACIGDDTHGPELSGYRTGYRRSMHARASRSAAVVCRRRRENASFSGNSRSDYGVDRTLAGLERRRALASPIWRGTRDGYRPQCASSLYSL